MKLQIALDEQSVDEGLALCGSIREHIDIIEIGTPFLVRDGLHAVRAFREAFPEKRILADAKIMDAGTAEATDCFAAGADLVTVLGVTDDLTIRACQRVAEQYGGKIVVDMICVRNLSKRVMELEAFGIRNIAVHTGIDQQLAGRTPLDDLITIRSAANLAEIFVAGGIGLDTVEQYKQAGAAVAIVGGGIAHAKNPIATAKAIAAKVHD